MSRTIHPSHAALVALLAALPLAAQSPALISPADRAVFEGSASTSYPLGRFDHRLQQLHADLGPGARTLTGHAYRRDAINTRDRLDAFAVDLEVVAATAPHAPDQASATFASNLGSDATLVLPRVTLSFPTTLRPPVDPAPAFDFRIPWSTPFQLGAGATLCLDVTILGNQTASGANRNFTALLDSHDFPSDGSSTQPGFRYGAGCPAAGASAPHSASLAFTVDAQGGLGLDIASRDGVPTLPGGPVARLAMIVGLGPQATPWPFKAGCTILPSFDATYSLPGATDAAGDWTGSVAGFPALPPGTRFHVQLASGIAGVDVTFSDASVLTVPPLAVPVLPAVRVASASDHSATAGTIARSAAVTGFF
ncbi:MAG: hypothetical protein IPM29_13265 [Planctomycetes bacterium]|nr:hypothetical protein [Planctomycetota bacterium]